VIAVAPRDALLAAARDADARIARGEARPLEGIPLGVKDFEHVRGLPTTEGSLLFAGSVADHDDVHVARLRAAGPSRSARPTCRSSASAPSPATCCTA
jgi:amidase